MRGGSRVATKNEWLSIVIHGEMVEINGKGETRKPRPKKERT